MEDLATWRDRARVRQADVGQFVGKELIAIHGDSLLVRCLSSDNDLTDTLQILPVVHAVERFLCKLRDRNCCFQVLWFASHEGLLPSAFGARACQHRLRLARAVLIEHLRQHPDVVQSICFASMDCQEYRQYLVETPPRLFVVSDIEPKEAKAVALTFESLIYRWTTEGRRVALIDDMEFRGAEIRATFFFAAGGSKYDAADWPDVPLSPSWSEDDADAAECVRLENAFHRIRGVLPSLRARLAVAVLAALLQRRGNNIPSMQARAAMLLAHVVVLETCPLPQRPVRTKRLSDKDDVLFLDMFCAYTRILFEQRPWADNDNYDAKSKYDLYDLVDGMLWLDVRDRPFTPEMVARCKELVSSLSLLCVNHDGIDLLRYLPDPVDNGGSSSSVDDTPPAVHGGSVLPFSHPDFDGFLKSVDVAEDAGVDDNEDDDDEDAKGKVAPFYHKPAQQSSTTSWEAKRILRRNQRRMADMQAYASSLTNANGKVLEPEIVVTAKKSDKTKKAAAAEKKALKTKAKALKDQKDRRASEILAKWKTAYTANLAKKRDPLVRYQEATRYVQNLSSLERDVIGADAVLHVCAVLMGHLADKKKSQAVSDLSGLTARLGAALRVRPVLQGSAAVEEKEQPQVVPDLAPLVALLWMHVQELARLPLSEEAVQVTQALCAAFNLDLGPLVVAADAAGHELLCKTEVLQTVARLTDKKLPPPPLGTAFQLAHCGPYLERGFDAQPDSRVVGFAPDGWQRQVLDTIDARESLFVVAPTSAGKTFISFYAMKQVLQESDDGVLVYVAPTKALVNQVAAEIQARFTKASSSSSTSSSSSPVWAVLTQDYSVNSPTNCQVLVTEPKVLLSLLLAPHNSGGGSGATSRPWPPRIRWIIFDEVHCIGQADEGAVWEQLLMLSPCPLLALSATVGNPGEFQAWLAGCERAKGRTLRTITHAARYSDLRSYVWAPEKKHVPFTGFKVPAMRIIPTQRWPIPGLEADGCNDDDNDNDPTPFSFVHPVAGLVDRGRPTLDDISFEPRDCLLLWRALEDNATKAFPVDPALAPDSFFAQQPPTALTKARVATWEARLKAVLLHWMHDGQSPFPDVLRDLSPACLSAKTNTQTPPPLPPVPKNQDFTVGVLDMLAALQRRAAIPALLFLYDRADCEHLVKSVVDQLVAAEQAWKASSEEWKDTMAAFEKHKATSAAMARKNKATRDTGDKGASKLDNLREAASAATYSKWDSFDPDEPQPKFSLADTTKLLVAERERQIEAFSYIGLPDFVIQGLRRGVGVHHAGMNRKYRQTVEMLFRRGYLTVVVCTGTLAMGINMPCRTVVFLGDSWLNALNYRQASGRAGRRGFDLLGNVVHYGFTPSRVRALLGGRLSDLRGGHHVVLTPSLLLRVSMLLHSSKGSKATYAHEMVRALCAQTRVSMVGPAGSTTVAHHLRFVIEFLRRSGLLSARGVPRSRSPAVVVAQLAYAEEDGAFALAALLRGGYFQRECAALAEATALDEQRLLQRLVLVLAHLFVRRPYRYRHDQPKSMEMVLPPLPDAAAALLRQHNARTQTTLQTYMQSYVCQHLADQPDRSLPLTDTVVGPDVDDSGSLTTATVLRSPFCALSGWDNTGFKSVNHLCRNVRTGVDTEAAVAAAPALPLTPEDTDDVPLNSFIYDFFRHGSLTTLVRSASQGGNGIRRSDVWFHLRDFSAVLAAIVIGLKQLVDGPGAAGTASEDLATEDRLTGGGRDGDTDKTDEPVLKRASPVVTKKPPKPLPKPPQKKVLDSWDDESSDDDDDDGHNGDETNGDDDNGDDDNGDEQPGTTDREDLRPVLEAFVKIQEQFDTKFRAMWA